MKRSLAVSVIGGVIALGSCIIIAHAKPATYPAVGPAGSGKYFLPTGQYIKPAGDALVFFGRPSDLAFDPEHKLLAIKNSHGLVLVDPHRWQIRQNLAMPPLDVDFAEHLGGNGPAGIVWSADGKEIWTTDSFGWIHGARIRRGGHFSWADRIALPSPSGAMIFKNDKNGTSLDSSAPIGLALGDDGRTLFVALSRDNAIAATDTMSHRVRYRVSVGNAPFGVLRIGRFLYVSNWAGRRSDGSESVADSSGTPIRVDPITWGAMLTRSNNWPTCCHWPPSSRSLGISTLARSSAPVNMRWCSTNCSSCEAFDFISWPSRQNATHVWETERLRSVDWVCARRPSIQLTERPAEFRAPYERVSPRRYRLAGLAISAS